MIRSRSSWLAVLACGALIAGCGSSSSTTSSQSSSSAGSAPTTSSTSTTPSTASTPTSTSGGSVQAKIEACKQEVGAQSSLPASVKPKLEAACVKAANGDTNAVKVVAREICEEVIDKSTIPAGAARDQALKACKGKTK